jgi:hypothetical protein
VIRLSIVLEEQQKSLCKNLLSFYHCVRAIMTEEVTFGRKQNPLVELEMPADFK